MAFYFAFFNVSNANQELRDRRVKSQKGKEKRRHSEVSVMNNQSGANDCILLPRPRVVSSHSIRPPTPPRRTSSPDEICCGTTASACALVRQRSPESRNKKVTFEQLSASREQLIRQRRELSASDFLDNRQAWTTTKKLDKPNVRQWVYSIELPAPSSTPEIEFIRKTERFQKSTTPSQDFPTTSLLSAASIPYAHSKTNHGQSPVWVRRADKCYRRESVPFSIYGHELELNADFSRIRYKNQNGNTWPPIFRKNWHSRILRRRSTSDRASVIHYEPFHKPNRTSSRPNFLPIHHANKRCSEHLYCSSKSRRTEPDVVPLIRKENTETDDVYGCFEFSEMKKLVESNIF